MIDVITQYVWLIITDDGLGIMIRNVGGYYIEF